jgi:two-component system sensor histidine kinase PhoQ
VREYQETISGLREKLYLGFGGALLVSAGFCCGVA